MAPTGTQPLTFPTRVRYGVLVFICTLALITYLDRVCISRVQGEIQRDLSISSQGMGLVFGAFLLGYALFEVPGGWMGDIWGSRRVVFRIVVWWSLFTALTGCVWASSTAGLALVMMLLVRFLFGAGEAGVFPNLTRIVGVWFPYRERGRAQGAIWMSARLGGAIAPLVIGALTGWLGWRQAFWVLGLIGAVWAIGFWYWFRDRPEDMPACNEAERELIRSDRMHTPSGHGPDSAGHSWPPLRNLVGSLTLWALCVASFGVSFGWYFYPTWQPRYLKDVYGISFDKSEILTGLPFLCGACGCLVGGRLSDFLIQRTGSRRWGRSLIGLVGFTGAGLCVLATGYTTAPWQAVGLLCLAFLVNDLAIPCIWAATADIGGRYVGTVAGIMNTTGAVGGMISPVMIPFILGDSHEAGSTIASALGQSAGPANAWTVGLSAQTMVRAVIIPADRWQIIFVILAGSWFVSAAAWLFIDASKPLFPVEQKSGAGPGDGSNETVPSSERPRSEETGIQGQRTEFRE